MKLSKRAVVLAVAFGLGGGQEKAFSYTDFGQGRPVMTQDLSGKHFCWGNGVRTFYGADGMLSNSRGINNMQWLIIEPGLFKAGRTRIQMEVLSDGRLHTYRYCLLCGDHDIDAWATPCE